jgi:di/tricarboxylate transporter
MDQLFVIAVLGVALVLFVWGRWRYDVVALGALLALVVPRIVDPAEAFLGFGHPAVVTVAAVLVISRGLERAGVVELVSRGMARVGDRLVLQVSALTLLVALFSAFMNNVGALALFLPVAIRMAREHDRPASLLLMPLAFGSLLGGLTTLVGTPPNIIIATIRARETGRAFGMFDFTPVGAGVALAGILLICLVGWRWLPHRKGEASRDELFEVDDYLSEVRVPEGSRWVGRSVSGLGEALSGRIVVVGIARGDREITAPSGQQPLRAEDVLLVEAEPEDLRELVDREGLEPAGTRELKDRLLTSGDEVQVVEAVVQADSRLAGSTARELELRAGHGVNLLGVARQGRRVAGRVADTVFRPGDVLLLQGAPDAVQKTLSALGGLPLAERGLEIGGRRRVAAAAAIFAGGIALTVAGVLPVQVALTASALVMVATGLLPLREAYEAVDWPVVVLLGAMLPVGEALETTGAAGSMAGLLLEAGARLPAEASVAAVLVAATLLSNVINNAAAAVVMAPIGLAVARGLAVSPDPFLMAVAVGASCAFLTPIGHQSNTLVMGPGGYRFGDYLYLGVPVTLVVLAAAVPLILVVWPL